MQIWHLTHSMSFIQCLGKTVNTEGGIWNYGAIILSKQLNLFYYHYYSTQLLMKDKLCNKTCHTLLSVP